MLKVIELFAGIGSQHQALLNIGVEHEVVAISEIDKYCLKSYQALHGDIPNLGDICKIEKLPQADLWTYSFPCQDISVAGNLAGISKGTRSGLLYEVERLLNVAKDEGTLPKYLLLENVKNLVSKRFKDDFNKWLEYLESLGYKNYWQILNAKDYGIPQNRERVFCVSIRGEHSPFIFPPKVPLTLKLKDLLEETVDEKYYLSQKMLNCFMAEDTGGYPRKERFLNNITRQNQDVGNAVTTLAGSRPTDNFVVESYGNKALDETLEQNSIEGGGFIDAFNRKVKKDVAGTITTRVSDSNCTFIAEKPKNEIRCDELIANGSVSEGDVVNHSRDAHNPLNTEDGVVPTLTTRGDELGVVVVDLKRGYSCEVKEEKEDVEGIDIIGNYSKSNFNQTSIVNKNGIAPTVTENHGQVTAIAIKNNTKQGYLLAEEGDAVDISGRMQWHRGTVQKGLSQTITTAGGDNVGVVIKESLYTETEKKLFTEDGNIRRYIGSDKIDEFKEGQMATTSYANGYGHGPRTHNESVSLTITERPSVKYNLRIRKLTSRECLRLMGWNDEQIDKIQGCGISCSQQYKQAGNGIVVQVLEAIFTSLFK